MSLNVLFDLPNELVVLVLEGLDFFDLARLESATVSKKYASTLQSSFLNYRLKDFPDLNDVNLTLDAGFNWLLYRGIQIENITMTVSELNQVLRNEQHLQILQSSAYFVYMTGLRADLASQLGEVFVAER